MITRATLEELKDQNIKVYVKDLPEQHCVHSGKLILVTEHMVKLYDEEHEVYAFIPIDQIALVRSL